MKAANFNQDMKRARESRKGALLEIIGWTSLVLGIIMLSLGLWTRFRGESNPTLATYKDESVYVTAAYGEDARIPKNAELRACLVTPETNPDGYAREMADALAAAGRADGAGAASAIYNVGFYVDDKEVEPAAPVQVTVQLLRDGFTVGDPITVVHFGEDGAKVLAATQVDEDGFTTFTSTGFSDFVFLIGNTSQEGDITGLLDDVTITDAEGNPIEDGTLFVGEEYHIHLEFREGGPQGDQFKWSEDGKLTYQIPENFKVEPRDPAPLKIMIDGQEVTVGTYSIDENGLLIIELSDEGKQALDSSNDVAFSFDMEASAQAAPDGSDTDVHFGDAGEDFNFKITDQPQIKADKTGSYDSENEILSYTVSAKVEHGEVNDLEITDTLTIPQTDSAVTLDMITDENGQPAVTVTVKKNGVEELVTLGPEDYEVVLVEDPENPGKQTFRLKLKEGSVYNPLEEGDELFVTYQYQVNFDDESYGRFWANVVNDATITGTMPVTDPQTGETNDIPVEEKVSSQMEVDRPNPGDGVVSKAEDYNEATATLHYDLYVAVAAGEYEPFAITDYTTVYQNKLWYVMWSKDGGANLAPEIKNLKVYARNLETWEERKNGFAVPETDWGEPLPGWTLSQARAGNTGYDSSSMDNYLYQPNTANLQIWFGLDNTTHRQGYWNCENHRLIKVSYDLDVSNGLTLYNVESQETIELTKDELLMAGLKNAVNLTHDHYSSTYQVFFGNGEKLNKTGKLDKNTNTIDYTVTLGLGDSTVLQYLIDMANATSTPDGWGRSVEFVDDYPDGWLYVDGSLKATIYAREGSYRAFTYDPKARSWYFADTDFSDGTINATLGGFKQGEGTLNGNWLDQVFQWNPNVTLDRIEFTYTLKASDEWLEAHAHDWEETPIHNSASIKDQNMTHWEAEADIPYFPSRLTKQAEQVGQSNLLRFTLHINPYADDLDAEKDVLIVTDTSKNLQIQINTIEVLDANGQAVPFEMLPTEDGSQFKLQVPDSTALTIKYDALIPETGTDVEVSNEASIDGVDRTNAGYSGSLQVSDISGGGNGSIYELTVKKTDSANNAKNLQGARFQFYIVRNEDSTLEETDEISVGDRKYSCYTEESWVFETDENGSFKIDKSKNWRLGPGNYYILVEQEAPEGYEMLDAPIVFYYGARNGIDGEKYPDATFALPNGTLTVTNNANPYMLPETGGPGVFAFAATGLALIFGSAVILVLKKRLQRGR